MLYSLLLSLRRKEEGKMGLTRLGSMRRIGSMRFDKREHKTNGVDNHICTDEHEANKALQRERLLRSKILEGRLLTMRRVSVFQPLSDAQLERLIDTAMEEVVFEEGEYILRQGNVGNAMYLLEEGKIKATRRYDAENEDETPQVVGKRVAPQYFGDLALLISRPRGTNIVAYEGPVKCLK